MIWEGYPDVSELDHQMLAIRMELYNKISGPRPGDFVKLSDGTYQRFTRIYPGAIQAGASANSEGFYLGHGTMSYSGGLNPGVKLSDLIKTDETKNGDVWFFHNNEFKAFNGIHFKVPFRVFMLKSDADTSGLWPL
jgi:hypothetical protein